MKNNICDGFFLCFLAEKNPIQKKQFSATRSRKIVKIYFSACRKVFLPIFLLAAVFLLLLHITACFLLSLGLVVYFRLKKNFMLLQQNFGVSRVFPSQQKKKKFHVGNSEMKNFLSATTAYSFLNFILSAHIVILCEFYAGCSEFCMIYAIPNKHGFFRQRRVFSV